MEDKKEEGALTDKKLQQLIETSTQFGKEYVERYEELVRTHDASYRGEMANGIKGVFSSIVMKGAEVGCHILHPGGPHGMAAGVLGAFIGAAIMLPVATLTTVVGSPVIATVETGDLAN